VHRGRGRQVADCRQSGVLDLVLCEDMARVCRRNRAIYICELCEDHDTRLIAINDNLDTE